MPTVCELRVSIKELDPTAKVYVDKKKLEYMHRSLVYAKDRGEKKTAKKVAKEVAKKTARANMNYSDLSKALKKDKIKAKAKTERKQLMTLANVGTRKRMGQAGGK